MSDNSYHDAVQADADTYQRPETVVEAFEASIIDNASYGLASQLPYCALALNGEAGEVAEWVKKVELRGRPGDLTDEDLLLELGDVLWYLTRMAQIKGWTLEDVMRANMAKLAARRAAKS